MLGILKVKKAWFSPHFLDPYMTDHQHQDIFPSFFVAQVHRKYEIGTPTIKL